MKKLYSRSLFAFLSCKKDRIKALKIFFLALALSSFGYSVSAQVVVTPANDTGICAQTATNGSAPGCTSEAGTPPWSRCGPQPGSQTR